MKIILEFDIEKEDTKEDVMDALNGSSYKGVLWELLINKRKQIVESKYEDNGMEAQAEGAEEVFRAIRDELDAWNLQIE